MSEAEGFAARWSRLKRASTKEQRDARSAEAVLQPPAAAAPSEASPPSGREVQSNTAEPRKAVFDTESLPPIDSITAASDIKAFLQAGVPGELTKAALRRAWSADPAIRDFIGLAENQWDFTDPTAMPGFGPLEATDDMRQLIAQAMGRLDDLSAPPATDEIALASQEAQTDRASTAPGAFAAPQTDSIPQEDLPPWPQAHAEEAEQRHRDPGAPALGSTDEACTVQSRRVHGGALPR